MNIVLVILCCGMAGAILILVAPFALTTRFSCRQNSRGGVFLLHWMHPWVAFVKYTIGSGTTELRLFGWSRTIPGQQASGVPEDQPPVREAAAEKKAGPSAAPAIDNRILKQSAESQPSASRRSPDTATDRAASPVPKTEKPEDSSGRGRFTWSKVKRMVAILRRGRAFPKIFRWCKRLLGMSLRIIRFDHLRLHAAAGAPDPADTGKLFGYFTALHTVVFSGRKNCDVSLEPRFADTVLEVEGSVGLKTSIAGIILPVVVALLTFPYITVFFVWRRLKNVFMESGRPEDLKQYAGNS